MSKTLDVLQILIDLSILISLRDWSYVVSKTESRGFSTGKEYCFNDEDFKLFRTPEEVGIAVKNDTGNFEHINYSEFLSFFDCK